MQVVLVLDIREQFGGAGHSSGRRETRDAYIDMMRRKGLEVEARHLEGTAISDSLLLMSEK